MQVHTILIVTCPLNSGVQMCFVKTVITCATLDEKPDVAHPGERQPYEEAEVALHIAPDWRMLSTTRHSQHELVILHAPI